MKKGAESVISALLHFDLHSTVNIPIFTDPITVTTPLTKIQRRVSEVLQRHAAFCYINVCQANGIKS